MAKSKKEQTPIQKAADAARAKYQAAKAANEKADNAATKKALADAKEAMRAAVEKENEERFSTVGTQRVRKARAALRNVAKVANPKGYKYTPEQAGKIISGLKEVMKEVEAAFTSTGGAKDAGDDFSL